ncbi:MAG: RNA-binding protein [Dehalococcoidia bacterium]|nr:RNA-binding protein [Dehalococcoidia bacterium]
MHRSEGRSVRLYVGNLPFSTTDEDLRQLFETHGELVSANVVRDRDTGRSRGFGFVEFSSDDAAQAAMSALDGTDMGGRALTVNEARERRSGFGGGGGGGGYGGGRGGDRGGDRPSRY